MQCTSLQRGGARRILRLAAVATLTLSTGIGAAEKPPAEPAAAQAAIDLAALQPGVAPGENFYAFANGGWMEATQIPPDRGRWSVFAALEEDTDKRVVALIEEVARGKASAAEARKVADFYSAYMDEAGIESKGLTPLQPLLRRIAAIADKRALAGTLGATLRTDVDALNSTHFETENLFGLWVVQGLHDPARYTPYLLQGGLGMPDREYYLSDAPAMREIRAKYLTHVATVLTLAGVTDAERRAGGIFDLETAIAKSHASRADSEDVQKGDNTWTRQDFPRKAPGLDWPAFFDGAGLAHQGTYTVWHPGAVTGEAALVAATPLTVWKDYLAYHAVNRHSGVLPKALVDEQFAFYGTTLNGTPQLRARWKRALEATNAALGDGVGRLYVAHYFPPPAKARAQAMVTNIVAAFGQRIDRLDWMAPATKAQAHAKLKTLYVGIGYPDKWRDYTKLAIRADDALGNVMRGELFEYRRDIGKLGRRVDRTEWSMRPQTVNAVNMPLQNALNFPAAILQPPFFDPAAPDALNYGAMGSTIGHEISHSFDDQGSQFDAQGRLRDWWTADDLAHFKASSAALATQYSAYHPFSDLPINGQQTLSENIADLGGILVAYDGYRASLAGQPAPARQGYSGDQQFFIAFAQSWRSKQREPALRQQLTTDGHAPGQYRALTVRNVDAWYRSFDVKPGQDLFLEPQARVRIW